MNVEDLTPEQQTEYMKLVREAQQYIASAEMLMARSGVMVSELVFLQTKIGNAQSQSLVIKDVDLFLQLTRKRGELCRKLAEFRQDQIAQMETFLDQMRAEVDNALDA